MIQSNYKFSFILCVIAILYYLASYLYNVDAVEFIVSRLEKFEQYELDEVIICSLLFGIGVIIDLKRRLNSMKQKEEKLELYKGTMSAVLHIFNNFLQNVYYFNQYAKESNLLNKEELDRFEKTIFENKEKITGLYNMENISIEKLNAIIKAPEENKTIKEE